MTKPSYPSWLPDWRDESQYPDPEKTKPEQWAWEFLRRRKFYSTMYTSKNNFDKSDYQRILKHLGITQFVNPEEDHPFELNLEQPLAFLPFEEIIEPEAFSNLNAEMNFEELPDDQEVSLTVAPWQVPVIFDISYPLTAQIDNVHRHLRERQKHLLCGDAEKRKSEENYLQYLRLLDARELEITYPNIAQYLFPKETKELPDENGIDGITRCVERLKKQYVAAVKLRDHDYRIIALV